MSPFEYVSVLLSIILGLGISVILTGLADIIRRWHQIQLYWPYAVWILIVFVLHLQEWWISYSLRGEMTWTLPLFLFIVIYPISLFILANLLFPKRWTKEKLDTKKYYLENYRKFFGAALLLVIISLLQNIVLLQYEVEDQYAQFLIAFMFLYLLWAKQIHASIHGLVAILMMIMLMLSFWLSPETLSLH